MIYEQGGIRAGRAILIEEGDTLTLADRTAHHRTTALATVETAANNASRVIDNFGRYFRESAAQPPGDYKTFVIKGDNPTPRLKSFCRLLDRNRIRYGKVCLAMRCFL